MASDALVGYTVRRLPCLAMSPHDLCEISPSICAAKDLFHSNSQRRKTTRGTIVFFSSAIIISDVREMYGEVPTRGTSTRNVNATS